MKKLNRSFTYLFCLIILPALFTACSSNNSNNNKPIPSATINIIDQGAKDNGLDLQALGELIKKSPNPKDLEKTLNSPGSINNLDMDTDGKVDFIKVSETSIDANNQKLTFTDVVTNGSMNDLADVTISKGTNNQASMDIAGSPAVYNNTSYHSDFSIGEVLLMAYLFSPHSMYYSPYRYGAYPPYYRPYQPVPSSSYRKTVTTYTSHPTGTVTKVSGSSNSRSLSSSGKSQRSFSTRSSSKPVGSGGFGSKSSSSTTTSSSTSSGSHGFGSGSSSSSSRSSSSSSSRRSFGSSRRR